MQPVWQAAEGEGKGKDERAKLGRIACHEHSAISCFLPWREPTMTTITPVTHHKTNAMGRHVTDVVDLFGLRK